MLVQVLLSQSVDGRKLTAISLCTSSLSAFLSGRPGSVSMSGASHAADPGSNLGEGDFINRPTFEFGFYGCVGLENGIKLARQLQSDL